MNPVKMQQCDSCAQVWKIEQVDLMTAHAPTFCPFCGKPTTRFIRSHFTSFSAACFRNAPDELIRLIYVDWATNQHDERLKYPQFVDYFWAKMAEE